MNLQMLKSFRFELEKIAARRGLKEIRRLVGAGRAEQAAALAKRPGVLKPTAAGHQIRDIGKGSEGLATLVAGPEHGLAVRKTFDPKGIASPELIARKEQAGRALQSSPHVAKFHGSQKGVGGTTAHTMEYVPGAAPGQTAKAYPAVQAARKGIAKGMRQAGFVGAADVRPENLIQTPTGQVKAIDYIPTQKGEFVSGNVRARLNQQLAAQGRQGFGKNVQIQAGERTPLQDPSGSMSPGQLKALHFRGVQPAAQKPTMQAATPAPAPTRLDRPLMPTRPMKAPQLAPTQPMKTRPTV